MSKFDEVIEELSGDLCVDDYGMEGGDCSKRGTCFDCWKECLLEIMSQTK